MDRTIWNKSLSVYEKEFLDRYYICNIQMDTLFGIRLIFFIKTDHQSIKFLLELRLHKNFQQRTSKLLGVDYNTSYRKGMDNKVVDALSRRTDN